MTRQVFIGCAGWSVASGRPEFGEGASVLERYATRFNAVEINSSFYRPHRPATYTKWAASTPPGFRFSVKVPKAVTHSAKLRDCRAPSLNSWSRSVTWATSWGQCWCNCPPA